MMASSAFHLVSTSCFSLAVLQLFDWILDFWSNGFLFACLLAAKMRMRWPGPLHACYIKSLDLQPTCNIPSSTNCLSARFMF